jgi:hypothetical protein
MDQRGVTAGIIMMICVELYFLTIGVACLIWPYKIKEFLLSQEGSILFFNPFRQWVRTPYYLWSLRAVGILSLSCSIVAAGPILRHLWN